MAVSFGAYSQAIPFPGILTFENPVEEAISTFSDSTAYATGARPTDSTTLALRPALLVHLHVLETLEENTLIDTVSRYRVLFITDQYSSEFGGSKWISADTQTVTLPELFPHESYIEGFGRTYAYGDNFVIFRFDGVLIRQMRNDGFSKTYYLQKILKEEF